MTFTVEYTARGSAPGEGNGAPSTLVAERATEIFSTEAEALAFVSRLPPQRDPVLVREDGERIRGPALSLHVVGWQDTHEAVTSAPDTP